jgi:hypothetical protein
MKFKSAKQLILHTCDKYWDAKQSYKKLIIYCFMEQGAPFPLTVEDLMRCYSTETIRRTFQELKREGEIRVSDDVQSDWNEKEKKIHSYYSKRSKKHKNYAPGWETWAMVDQEGNRVTI